MATQTKIIRLLEIACPDETIFRFQNWQLEDYIYKGIAYQYLPFDVDSDPQANIDLDNAPSSIIIANHEIIREAVQTKDGLRRSIVTITLLKADLLDEIPYTTRTQVLKTSFAGAAIQFQMESPVNAVAGRFPSIFFTGKQWRELPQSAQASFR